MNNNTHKVAERELVSATEAMWFLGLKTRKSISDLVVKGELDCAIISKRFNKGLVVFSRFELENLKRERDKKRNGKNK